MSERFKFSLSSMWLFISLFTIILPVFLPSSAFSVNPASNAIGVATAAMFILSFPSSLFGLAAMFFVHATFSLKPESMEGLYVNLLVMFALGLVQWFWVVPRVWRNDPQFQTIEIPLDIPVPHFKPAIPKPSLLTVETDDRTPIERVIMEDAILNKDR
jgi:hypothetical protein